MTLVESVCGLLRRTYALEAPLLPIGAYIIGDAGFRALYAEEAIEAGSEAGEGARLLVRDARDGIRARIYFPDSMIARLEARPPQRGLDEDNVDAFAVLVEELDHLLVTAERAHGGRGVSLLELELQANVSKDLVLSRFLAGSRPRLSRTRRHWLRHHLFFKRVYSDADAEVRARYDEAARSALRFLGALDAVPRTRRVGALRRFHRAPLGEKLALSWPGRPL